MPAARDATDANHRVHGLDADTAEPDWPPLTPAEVTGVLAHYPDVGEMREVAWHSPRPLSAAARLHTAAGELFVKRHHARVRTARTLGEEHRFIAHLRANGLPVPAVLARADGQTAHTAGDWVYEVHACARGLDLYREAMSWTPPRRVQHAHAAGRALARLHAASCGYDAQQRGTHMLVTRDDLIVSGDPLGMLARQLPHRPALRDYLQRRDWRGELAPVLAHRQEAVATALQQQPRLWTHNDWHVSNMCWSGSGANATVTDMLDFGLASPTSAVFDLATAIERNAIEWLALDKGHAAAHADIAAALIAGYRDTAALDAAAVHAVATVLPLVHVDFALSETEYFLAATRQPGHADVAYETFLRGHAAWFDTPPGQGLLDALHALA